MINDPGNSILYVAIGIPGSGKTTNEPHNTWSVCPDNIRAYLYGDASIQGDGKKVFSIAYNIAQRLLADGKDVYFDATNTTKYTRQLLLRKLKPYASKCVALYFNIPIEVCKYRNAHRSRVVPEHVIVWLCTALTAACIVVVTICFSIKVIIWSFELLKPLQIGLAIAGATVILVYKSRDSLK